MSLSVTYCLVAFEGLVSNATLNDLGQTKSFPQNSTIVINILPVLEHSVMITVDGVRSQVPDQMSVTIGFVVLIL